MSLLKKDSESDPFKELKRILKQVSLKHCGQVERMECGHPLPPRWTGADKHTQASLLACCLFLYCLKAKGGITYFSIQNFKKKKEIMQSWVFGMGIYAPDYVKYFLSGSSQKILLVCGNSSKLVVCPLPEHQLICSLSVVMHNLDMHESIINVLFHFALYIFHF